MRFNIWQTQEQSVASMATKPGAVVTRHKTLAIVAVLYPVAGGRASFAIWQGKSIKPRFHYVFRTMESAQKNLPHYWKQAETSLGYRADLKKEKAEKQANLRASDHYSVGDVIYNSWGYDQTNVDYYEVVEVKAKSVVIREVAQNRSQTGYMSGQAQPRRGEYVGKPQLKPLGPTGWISFRHGGATKWDGKPNYFSTYA